MYIGITGIDPVQRWEKGYTKNQKIYKAFQKYGWGGFDHRVLLSGLSKEEAEVIEQNLIQDLETQDDRYGYNIANGGRVHCMSDETKKKISDKQKGHRDYGGGNPKRKVLCVETGQVFESCSEAARWSGSNSSHISNACRGNFEKTKGYHWRFA